MKDAILEMIENYARIFPSEAMKVEELRAFVHNNATRLIDRKNPAGHLVASAFTIHEDKILLIEHPYLGVNLQPGGHIDAGELPIVAAQREALEETGYTVNIHPWHKLHNAPLDIDIHLIPANPKKNEGEHYHFDFRYIFGIAEQMPKPSELEFAWFDINDPRTHKQQHVIKKYIELIKN